MAIRLRLTEDDVRVLKVALVDLICAYGSDGSPELQHDKWRADLLITRMEAAQAREKAQA